ncbi:hypothetical protein AUS19_17080 [Escherichia coli]|nr:hypothetical protein PU74_26210 [Escherichia coli]KHI09169.1 hypothetical protein PU43_13055 [Escherichia coli]KXK81956.1 hypothetical protein AUS13_10970 [Escherichia coli]KXL58894.1 hypothetical protein AUS26_18650 [Escherichia coli]KXM08918.1 hypothetical protein AUS19_17080 [Escherichia coli]
MLIQMTVTLVVVLAIFVLVHIMSYSIFFIQCFRNQFRNGVKEMELHPYLLFILDIFIGKIRSQVKP